MQSKDSFASWSEHWMVIAAKTDEVVNLILKDRAMLMKMRHYDK